MLSRSAHMVSFLLFAVDFTMSGTEPPEAMQHARNSYEMAKRGDLSGAGEEMRIAIRLPPENPLYVSALRGIGARQWEAGELVSARDNLAIAADARSADTKALAMIEEVSLELGASLA